MITENVSTLKIHKLTQTQYNRELANGNLDTNALYLTPDEVTPIENGGTNATTPTNARANLGLYQTLSSGLDLSVGGSVSCSDFLNYNIFQIILDSRHGTTMLAMRNGNFIRGGGSYSDATGKVVNYTFNAEVNIVVMGDEDTGATWNSEQWNIVSCQNYTINTNGTISDRVDCRVSEIIGIV